MKGGRSGENDARHHHLAGGVAVDREQLPHGFGHQSRNVRAIGDVDANLFPHHRGRGNEAHLRRRVNRQRDEVNTARTRFAHIAPLNAAGKRNARRALVVDPPLVNMPECPVVEPGAQQCHGVGGSLHRIERKPGVQHAHRKRRLGGARAQRPNGGGAGDTLGDVLVGRPHLVRVAAASDDRKGTPVALVQGEIGTIGGEHRGGRGQGEEILLPKTQRSWLPVHKYEGMPSASRRFNPSKKRR